MKKLTRRARTRDVLRSLLHRTQKKLKKVGNRPFEQVIYKIPSRSWVKTNDWIDRAAENGLEIRIGRKLNGVTLVLPEKMNFSSHYEQTMLYMSAIRKLAGAPIRVKKAYKLAMVDFERLKGISSSAALVLTAELSKWDDACKKKLKKLGKWDPDIQKRFIELGFFDLFENNPFKNNKAESDARIRHVRYIKGSSGEAMHKTLRQSLKDIVGEDIKKYTFLRSGLDEAITNVGQHAYPNSIDPAPSKRQHKYWYLTGGFNTETKDLKITFYDQGVGIPRTLPNSKIWESVLGFLSIFTPVEQKRDEVLLKAAMEYRRTSTKEHDRGKGLGDLLQFVDHRGNGYLSILSRHGLYKYSIENGEVKEKSERLPLPVQGTLIIWNTNLK